MDKWPGWDGWTPGGIRIRGPVKGGGTDAFATAGWIKGAFAVDLRPRVMLWGAELPDDACNFAWVLTHIPTGLAVAGMDAPMSMVQMLIDDLAKMTDWSAITLESAVFMSARVQDFFCDHPGIYFPVTDTLGPWDNQL